MKQKYKLTVADTEINVVTDEPKEEIDTVVGVVDRHLREIHLHSRNCSRTEAALLLSLDYCAEKLKLRKKLKAADAEINRLVMLNDAAARENAALTREVEALRKNLKMDAIVPPAPTKTINPVQLSIDDPKDEEAYPSSDDKASQAEPAPKSVDDGKEMPKDADGQSSRKKQNKVRSMFDLITFDDI